MPAEQADLLPIDPPKIPAHQSVYEQLRESLLFGDYAPGQALTIQGLIAETGAGMTPVREAIRRLTSEGAVRMLGNRRLVVPVLGSGDAEQLVFMRHTLEPELAARAAQRITEPELGRLREVDLALNAAIARGDVAGYLRHNYTFHHTLYQAAHAPVIAETVDRLWLQFGPSLRVICGRFGTLNLPDKHAEILGALERADPAATARATEEDAAQGMRQVLEAADSIDSG